MDDTLTGLRPVPGPTDAQRPIAVWRDEWQQAVAQADEIGGDARVATQRRDYGSYPFLGLDLVLALIASQIVLPLPLVLLLGVLFILSGHSLIVGHVINPELAAWTVSPFFTLAGLVVTDSALVLVLWYRLSRQRLGWAAMGLGRALWRGGRAQLPAPQAIALGLGVGAVGLVLSITLGGLLQHLGLDQSGQDKLLIEPLRHAPLAIVVAMVLAGTFVAPVVEELFFRGYLFRAAAVRHGALAAYLLSAATFAAFHLMPALFPVLFVLGLLLCFAYHRSGSLLSNITAHALNNGVAFALSLLPIIPHH